MKNSLSIIGLGLLATLTTQARSIEENLTHTSNHIEQECLDIISTTGICEDVDRLFNLIQLSVNDSNYGLTNQFLIPFKKGSEFP